jgi:uncharacterized membrane protein
MSKLSEAKILGGIGALLMLFGGFILPGLGAIVGLILIFIAVKYVSEECKDKSIFDNYLMHFVYTVIAIVAVVVIFFASIGGFTFFTVLESMDFTDFNSVWTFFEPYIMWWILALLIGWVFLIISSIYLKKSYYSIAKKTKVNSFRTTGLLYFIGAITLIIAVGIIIILIAKILEIIAYFHLPEKVPSKKT